MSSATKRAALLVSVVALPVLVGQALLGSLLEDDPTRAWLLALMFLLVVVLLTRPGAILVMALPATYLYFRVGPASTEISLADVALGVALLAALPFVPWRSRTMLSMLRVLGVYLLILAIPVAAVFSQRAVVEWGHRAFLVAASVLVGAAIAATAHTALALRAYVAASIVVAVGAIYDALSHWTAANGPAPAYPFGIQKNSRGIPTGGRARSCLSSSRILCPFGGLSELRRSLCSLLGLRHARRVVRRSCCSSSSCCGQ